MGAPLLCDRSICQIWRPKTSQTSTILPNQRSHSLLPHDEVDVDGWVEFELSDLLDGGRGAVDVNNALVDAHLVAVPSVGTVAAR